MLRQESTDSVNKSNAAKDVPHITFSLKNIYNHIKSCKVEAGTYLCISMSILCAN
jgi:hypothetical protein